MVLQESPHSAKDSQVFYLDLRQIVQCDVRAVVEFPIGVKHRLGPLHLGCLPDGFAVYQQLQVVGPGFPCPLKDKAKHQAPSFGFQGQGDRVFGPGSGARRRVVLFPASETNTAPWGVFSHPEVAGLVHVFGAHKAA